MHPPVQLKSTTKRVRPKPSPLRILSFLPLLVLLLSPPQTVPDSQPAYAIARATPPPAPPTPTPTPTPMPAPTDDTPVPDTPTALPSPPSPSPTPIPPSPSPSPIAPAAYTPPPPPVQPEQPVDQVVLPTMPPVGTWQTPQQLPGIGFSRPAPGDHPVGEPSPSPYPASVAPPAAAYLPAGQTRFIPILMYHYVRYVDQTQDPLGYRLSVTPEQFAGHLDWLSRQGYTTLRMDTVAECLQGLQACPQHAVALTFDDGYADAYTTVLPLLQQYGFVATFYVVSGFIGQPGYMGWAQLQALRDAGMEIGAHSISHPNLTALSQDQAYYQIVHSAQHISTGLQVPIVSFCYPAGQFNAEIAALVESAGYTSATTTMTHWYEGDLYALPRVRISGGLGQAGFQSLVQAYTP